MGSVCGDAVAAADVQAAGVMLDRQAGEVVAGAGSVVTGPVVGQEVLDLHWSE